MNEKNKNKDIPSFDMIPLMMANLLEDNKILTSKMDDLERRITSVMDGRGKNEEVRMNVEEAQRYIPSHPAVQTIYGWTSRNLIPYHKIGKCIYFLKTELDNWLAQGQHKSDDDIAKEAEEYVRSHKKKMS